MKEKDQTDLEKAHALILQDREARAKKFKELVEAASMETRCQFQIALTLQGNTVIPELKTLVLD